MGKFQGFFKRLDTIFNRLIISFVLIVVIVVVAVDSFLISRFSANYNEKIENLKLNQVDFLKIELERIFSEADKLMVEIASPGGKDENVLKLMNKTLDNSYYVAYEAMDYFNLMANQNEDYANGVEFYSLKNNLWLSSGSGISYTNSDSDKVLDEKGILGRRIMFGRDLRWVSDRTALRSGQPEEVYSVTAGYPLYTNDPSKFIGFIVINLSKEHINSILSENLSDPMDMVGIVDDNGSVLIASGNVDSYDGSFARVFQKENSDRFVRTMGDYILIGEKTGYEGWNIVNMVSRQAFYDETGAIIRQSIFISILVILAGIIFSYLFARNIYRPFFLIVNKLTPGAKLSKRVRENEYNYIDRAIDDLSQKAIVNEELLSRNINSIKHDFVSQIIFGKIRDTAEVQEKMKLIGYDRNYRKKCLMLIELHPKFKETIDASRLEYIYSDIVRFFYEYDDKEAYCIPINLLNSNICVFISDSNPLGKNFAIIRERLEDYLGMNYMLSPIIIQSGIFTELEEAHGKYKEITELEKYIYFLPRTYYLSTDEIERAPEEREFEDADFEGFTESLIARDQDNIEKVLRKFVETKNIFDYSVETLHGVILKYIFLYNFYLRDIMKEQNRTDNTQLYKELGHLYNVEDFYFWFTKLIKDTFAALSDQENNPRKTVITMVEEVIKENLSEDNLSLEFIAEKVYLSPKYISRIFKEETGVTITQYTNDLKLSKAAELLLDSNITLEELVKEVGYSSANYFIKKFKEKYHVTPTQYRRNNFTV